VCECVSVCCDKICPDDITYRGVTDGRFKTKNVKII
jgi:hypothetical protein